MEAFSLSNIRNFQKIMVMVRPRKILRVTIYIHQGVIPEKIISVIGFHRSFHPACSFSLIEDGCPFYHIKLSVIPIILLGGSLIIIVETGTEMKAYIKPSG
jgi:hypothetical protein